MMRNLEFLEIPKLFLEFVRRRIWATPWSPMEPFGAIWSHMDPYKALWSLMEPMEPYGALCMEPHGARWFPVEPYGGLCNSINVFNFTNARS